jgi:uncharacterized protein YndB with AHSA1/START domain
MRRIALPLVLAALAALSLGASELRRIDCDVTVAAPAVDVWKAWTTSDGARKFFAPDAKIELSIGGAYEIYFSKKAPEGTRGSEGCAILSYLPERMLSFSWNSPPDNPEIRKQHTWVVVRFDAVDDKHTRVSLTHMGFGEGKDWAEVKHHFEEAWPFVLNNLKESFEKGPIDWKKLGWE